jgi:hypothetical protein
MLITFGVIVGVIVAVEAREWLPTPEGGILVLVLWLPIYAFIVWPAIFALLGNYRLK